MDNNDERPLTTTEVANMVRVHASTIRRWADHEGMPAIRLIGGGRRFDQKALRQWLKARFGEPGDGA